MSTLSKIHDPLKGTQLLSTVPLHETHGLYLAATSLISAAKLMNEINIPISKIYLGTDAISTIITLNKVPSRFAQPFSKYYVDINTHLYVLAEITGQSPQLETSRNLKVF